MADSTLRGNLLRLAQDDEGLRPELLRILKATGGLTPEEEQRVRAGYTVDVPGEGQAQTVVVVSPNASPTGVPQTPSPTAVSGLFAPERTQRGFTSELLPELMRLEKGGLTKLEAARALLGAVNEAFSKKDMLYNILVQYQSSFENDWDFKENLEQLIESWATANNGA